MFALILLGQTVSIFGSQLTGFVLGVWVYQKTGSATQFSLIAFFATIPRMFFLPLAGAWADRFDRRWIMILGDIVAGLATLILFFLIRIDRLEVAHVYVITAIIAAATTFQGPALSASTVLMVPKRHLTRANAGFELGVASSLAVAPLIAGVLLERIELFGVVMIDVLSCAFAVLTLFLVRIPRPPQTDPESQKKRPVLKDAAFGWSYIQQRRGLLVLLIVFAFLNFTMGIVSVSFTPLVLSFASVVELGQVLAIAVVGTMVGSLLMLVWGGPNKRIPLIFAMMATQGSILLLGGVQPSIPLIATSAFVFMFCMPMITSSSQTIWQSKVAPDVQGRVFAMRRLIATSATPLAFLVAGPLTDYVFEPMLAESGLLAGSIGQIIGTGPGRGVGLLFICLGLAMLPILTLGYTYRPLRRLEEELPDALPGESAP